MLTRPPPAPRTFTTGAGAARRPGAALRRPQPLACLVLEAEVGAPGRRAVLLYRATTSAFHTMDRGRRRVPSPGAPGPGPTSRAGAISFEVPSMVYPTWNSRPDQGLDPAQGSTRWSLANPCASGPLPQLELQPGPLLRAQPLSRQHRPFGPQRFGPAVPARPGAHRRTDPSVTRRVMCDLADRVGRGRNARRPPSAAARAAAARRAYTRPVAHTACFGHTPASQPTSRPRRSTSSVWLIFSETH